MEKGKRVDVYLEVRKRRDIYFLNETSLCGGNVYFEIWGTDVQLELHTFSSTENMHAFHIIRHGFINP